MKSVHERKKPQKYGFESIWIFYNLRCPECKCKTKEENNFEDHDIKNHPMSFECDNCGKVLEEEKKIVGFLEYMKARENSSEIS